MTERAPPTLAALAARAQLGDRAALESLLTRLMEPLQQHVRRLLRDDDVALDVLQETLILVCRRLTTLRDTRWVRAWAYRIASRESLRALRRMGRAADVPFDEADLPVEAIGDVGGELEAALPELLARVPAGAQTVLRMHYLNEQSLDEVARTLRIPLGTVKSRLAYGLASLRRLVRRPGAT